MGITGLIPFLEKASSKVNLRDLRGTTVAVDTYCWLHKGVFTCAEKLARGEETDLYIQYCLKYIQMLLSFDIKPILVFDGQHLPAKALTEQRRREQRQQAKKRAAELLRLGKGEEARAQLRRCVDVTHEMALKLIKECRERNVDCIVAPYEADAQMAWLTKVDLAQYVITEDSDLTLFGARKIIFKLDLTGNGLLIEADKLHLAMGCRLEKYNFDKFRRMCIMSGCDYLDSLPGIGLAKACKFMLLTEEDNMWKALKKIPQYLKMRNLIVDDDYIENFLKAEATFKHMFIYNPLKRKMERLHHLEEMQTEEKYLKNAGIVLEDEEKAFNLALGNLNPFSLKQLDSWNPDQYGCLQQAPSKNVKRAKHASIWQSDFHQKKNSFGKNNQKESKSALFFKQVDFNSQSIEEEIQEKIAEENAKPHEGEIFTLYKFGYHQQKSTRYTKRKRSSSEEEDVKPPLSPAPNKAKHNPFAKIQNNEDPIDLQKSPKVCENSSLLKVLSPKKTKEEFKQHHSKLKSLKRNIFIEETEKVEVKSRFFASNLKKITQNKTNPISSMMKNSSETTLETHTIKNECSSLSEEIVKIENESQEKQEQQMLLYQSPSPKKICKNNNDFITPSHADSGLGSMASDTLYQNEILNNEDAPPATHLETDFKEETEKESPEENQGTNPSSTCDKDEAIVLSDSDSLESSQPSSQIKLAQYNNSATKTKTPSRLGLSKPRSKISQKPKVKVNSKEIYPAQMRLSAFGFQKRPTLK